MKTSVLIVDDDVNLNRLLHDFLGKNGFSVFSAYSAEDAIRELSHNEYAIVLTDLRLPQKDGLDLLQWINLHKPACSAILMTSYADVQTAVKAMKLGAYDYIAKPIVPDDLLKKIQDAHASGQTESRQSDEPTVSHAKKNPDPEVLAPFIAIGYIQGTSRATQQLTEHIRLVAPTPLTVLISGESGTGKEYIARLIHNNSKQAEGPFIAVDCGSIPKDLAGSELFGHKKGAFTGAVGDKIGFFQQAEGGTLFFDEIENLPYSVQIYLLRALQEKRIRPVGGEKDLDVHVRIIAATNENIPALCEKGLFRTDLYHRLNEFSIQGIPLRSRKEDILLFAGKFLEIANRELEKETPVTGMEKEVENLLLDYPWPGNIRELLYTIKRACLLCQTRTISIENLPIELQQWTSCSVAQTSGTNEPRISLAEEEKEKILSCLRKANYNKSKAARMLDIDRKTLYNKLKSYNIDL